MICTKYLPLDSYKAHPSHAPLFTGAVYPTGPTEWRLCQWESVGHRIAQRVRASVGKGQSQHKDDPSAFSGTHSLPPPATSVAQSVTAVAEQPLALTVTGFTCGCVCPSGQREHAVAYMGRTYQIHCSFQTGEKKLGKKQKKRKKEMTSTEQLHLLPAKLM